MAAQAPCAGCGGRNTADVNVCVWCARSLAGEAAPRATLSRLLAGGFAVLVVCLLLGATWLVLTTQRPIDNSTAASAAPTAAAAPPTSAPVLGEPPPDAPEEPPAPEVAEAPPPPPEYVRVVNTGGQGISLRREPGQAAPRITARAENAVLQVVGADETAEGRVWRQVQDAQGNRGWAPAEFLAPAPPPS